MSNQMLIPGSVWMILEQPRFVHIKKLVERMMATQNTCTLGLVVEDDNISVDQGLSLALYQECMETNFDLMDRLISRGEKYRNQKRVILMTDIGKKASLRNPFTRSAITSQDMFYEISKERLLLLFYAIKMGYVSASSDIMTQRRYARELKSETLTPEWEEIHTEVSQISTQIIQKATPQQAALAAAQADMIYTVDSSSVVGRDLPAALTYGDLITFFFSLQTSKLSGIDTQRMYKLICDNFTLDEIKRGLTFVGVNPDTIIGQGSTLEIGAFDLVSWAARTGGYNKIIQALSNVRENSPFQRVVVIPAFYYSPNMRNLRVVITQAFPNNDDIERIANASGLNRSYWGFLNTPANTWDKVFAEASKQHCFPTLIDILLQEVPAVAKKGLLDSTI